MISAEAYRRLLLYSITWGVGGDLLHSFRVYFHVFFTRFECIFTSSSLVSSVISRLLHSFGVYFFQGLLETDNRRKFNDKLAEIVTASGDQGSLPPTVKQATSAGETYSRIGVLKR